MDWITVIAIFIGLLINLIFNYLTSQDLLNDKRNLTFYLIIWALTAILLILARTIPEWTTETTLLCYTVIGISLPQMLVSILANNNFKDTNNKLKDANSKLKDANSKLKDANSKLKQKEIDYEKKLRINIFNFLVCDKVLIERLWGKDVDTEQILKIFDDRCKMLQLLETLNEKTRKEYFASISVTIGDAPVSNPPTNK